MQKGKKMGTTFGGAHFEVTETFDFLENLHKRPLNAFDYILLVALLFQVCLICPHFIPLSIHLLPAKREETTSFDFYGLLLLALKA